MALNVYLTLRAPIEIDYSATTSAGFSASSATRYLKIPERGIVSKLIGLGGMCGTLRGTPTTMPLETTSSNVTCVDIPGGVGDVHGSSY